LYAGLPAACYEGGFKIYYGRGDALNSLWLMLLNCLCCSRLPVTPPRALVDLGFEGEVNLLLFVFAIVGLRTLAGFLLLSY
jgi:hypothetical protein